MNKATLMLLMLAPLTSVAQPQEATKPQVAECTLIKETYAMSSWYGVFANKAVVSLKKQIIKEAMELGATHIVWDVPQFRYSATVVTASLYGC